MKPELLKELLQINTRPENRRFFTQLLLSDDETLLDVLQIVKEKDSKTSPKAARALEFVVQKNLERVLPFLADLFKVSKESNNDSVIRPMAKIFEIITLAYFRKNSTISLSKEQLLQITDICFEWMITDQKIATQAYSMRTLYLLGTKIDWIHPKLLLILKQNFQTGSVAYQARARKIIQQIESRDH